MILKFEFEFSEEELQKECMEKMEQEIVSIKKKTRNFFLGIPIILVSLSAMLYLMVNFPESIPIVFLCVFVLFTNIKLILDECMFFINKRIYETNKKLLQEKQWYSLAGNLQIINIVSYFGRDEALKEIQNKNNSQKAEVVLEDENCFLKINLNCGETYFLLSNQFINFENSSLVEFKRDGIYLQQEKTA